ncbi:MAG: HAD family hydrolase [Cyanobacteria bacterium P01_H01_bin.105]
MVTLSCNGKLFRNIHAVFLDKDGTLANVANYLIQLGHIQAQLMEQELPGTCALILKALGLTPEGLTASGLLAVGSRQETILGAASAAAITGCPWVQAVELATATFAIADKKCSPKAVYTPLLPGVLGLLQRLRQANLKLIMVSADSQSNLEQFVEHYELAAYFDHLQGVSNQNPSKTAFDFLPRACQAIGLLPNQGVVIGDSASDLRMAESAKGFIGYLGGWQPVLSPIDILGDMGSSVSLDCSFIADFRQLDILA